MDSIPGVWNAFLQIAERGGNDESDVIQDINFQRLSLLPDPLRPRATSTTTTTITATTHLQACSAPVTPSPTVFVSVCSPERSRSVPGQLSLHDYRKILSTPQVHSPKKLPERTLRRKPKAGNLHSLHTGQAPPSPPSTPSPSSSSSSTVSLVGDVELRSNSNLESNGGQRYLVSECQDLSQSIESVNVGEQCSCQQEGLFSCQHQWPVPRTKNGRLNALRDCLRQIPARFTNHTKSSSDSVIINSRHSKTVLRHKGVSFEILNPRNRFPPSSPRPPEDSIASRAPPVVEKPTVPGAPVLDMPSPNIPSLSNGDTLMRRPTPRLYEDLPTAHLSITSRIASNGKSIYSSPDLHHHKPCYNPAESNDVKVPERPSIPDSGADILSHNVAGHFTSPEAQTDTRPKQSKPVNRPPSNFPKIRKTRQRNREPSNCLRVRSISNFMSRRHTNLHAVRRRGRIVKPRLINGVSKRQYANSRHVQIIDGYFYAPGQVEEFEDVRDFSVAGSAGMHQNGAEEVLVISEQDTNSSPSSLDDSHLRVLQHANDLFSAQFNLPQPVRTRSQQPSISSHYGPQRESRFSPAAESCASEESIPCINNQQDDRGGDSTPTQINKPAVGNGSPPQSMCSVERAVDNVLDEYFHDSRPLAGINSRDLGPGSSQTTSTRLSQHTLSSAALKSQLQLPTVSKSDNSFISNPYSCSGLKAPPPFSAHDGHRQKTFCSSGELDPELDTGVDSDLDWETVAGSRQFGTSTRLGRTETGSSLANYSTFGSLANSEVHHLSSAQGIATSRRYQHASSPLQNVWTPQSNLRQAHFAGAQTADLDGDCHYRSSLNPFRVIPPLPASTRKRPAPITRESSQYRHPSPLSDSHNNPFRVTPPALVAGSTALSEQKGSKTGPLSTLRNCKSGFCGFDSVPTPGSNAVIEDAENISQSSCAHSSRQDEFRADDEAHYSPSEGAYRSSCSHIFGENQGFHNQRFSSPNNTALLAADGSQTDRHSDESIVSVKLDTQPRNGGRSSLNPLQKRDNSRNDAVLRSLSRERLIQGPSAPKFPPGSLYLSIRSARAQPESNSGRLSRATFADEHPANALTSNSTELSSPENKTHEPTDPQKDEPYDRKRSYVTPVSPCRATSPRHRSILNTPGRRESRRQDEAIRERLEQLEQEPPIRFRPPTSSQRLSRPVSIPLRELALPSIRESVFLGHRCTLTTTVTASVTAYSPTGWDDESTLAQSNSSPEWYTSPHARYMFSEPPHLVRRRPRLNSITAEDLIAQKQVGRQIILLGTLVVFVGWVMVGVIGFGGARTDGIIRWWSNRTVQEFHDRERRLARVLTYFFGLLVFSGAVTIAAVLLAKEG